MRNFKKAIFSAIGFLACVIVPVLVIVWPYFTGSLYYYEDAQVRDDLAGSIDFLISGASHGSCAFDPKALDEELGVQSYNLSGPLMGMQAREALLQKELARNPVDTVIVELSCNTLTRDRREEGIEGDLYALPRMGSFSEGAAYFQAAFAPEEYLSVLADTLQRGLQCWKDQLSGKASAVDPADKGFLERESVDLSMTGQEFAQLHNTVALDAEARWDNKEYLWSMVEQCQAQGIEVLFVTTPLSDRLLAQYSNLEESHQWSLYYAQQYGCAYLDFNLYRQRDALFPDDTAFYDLYHLSGSGAEIFSREVAELYQRMKAGEDVSALFYESYAEMDAAMAEAYGAS